MSGSPLGFAGVSAFGQHGTTGGLGGPEITVWDASSLLSAIREPGPAIVTSNQATFGRRIVRLGHLGRWSGWVTGMISSTCWATLELRA